LRLWGLELRVETLNQDHGLQTPAIREAEASPPRSVPAGRTWFPTTDVASSQEETSSTDVASSLLEERRGEERGGAAKWLPKWLGCEPRLRREVTTSWSRMCPHRLGLRVQFRVYGVRSTDYGLGCAAPVGQGHARAVEVWHAVEVPGSGFRV